MIHKNLDERGWAILESDLSDMDAVSAEFDKYYSRFLLADRYENVAQLDAENIQQSEVLSLLQRKVESALLCEGQVLALSKVWLVETSFSNVDTLGLPYVPHIDKDRYVKAMIYLDDVGVDDGPLTMASQAPADYEKLRLSFTKNYKARKENFINHIPIEDYTPCIGKAGAVIFFDTNCPHFAGSVAKGARRRIIRFDYFKKEWRKKSGFLGKLILK